MYFFHVLRKQTSSKSCLLQLIRGWSKVHEENVLREHALTFDQSKIFSKNYKPITVHICMAYKITENNCDSRLFVKFIQTQKSYLISLDEISISTWSLLVISSQIFSCEIDSSRTYFLQNVSCLPLWLSLFYMSIRFSFPMTVTLGVLVKVRLSLRTIIWNNQSREIYCYSFR